MPAKKRFKTTYSGVYYIDGISVKNKPERIYYIMYRKNGKLIEEKVGRQYRDAMTPARAAGIRGQRIDGNQLSNREERELKRKTEQTEKGKWTVDKLWNFYKSQKPDSKGLHTDENRYENYLKPKFGDLEPKDLIQLDTDRLRITLLRKKKPQTVKHVLALLLRIINFGVKKGLCQGLQYKIEMPIVNNIKTEDLSSDQLEKLLGVLNNTKVNLQAASIMKMALFTGMRRGELFKLKWDDIDFERGFIHIRDPKGGVDQTIPLNDSAREILSTVQKTDSPFVFPGREGKQKTDIKRAVNKIKKEAELPNDFRPLHGLRHVYASMLASSGKVDMYTLQKLLTHKKPEMTQRYAHLRDDVLKNASNLAGELIKEVINKKKKDTKKLKPQDAI